MEKLHKSVNKDKLLFIIQGKGLTVFALIFLKLNISVIKLQTYAFQLFLRKLRIDESQLDDTGLAYVRDYRFDVLLAMIDYVLSPYNAAKPPEPDRVVKRLLDIKILFEQGKITNEERQKIYKQHNIK